MCTSATLSSRGSNQCSLHSQWESKKVRTGAVAASAPRTLERIRPEGNTRKQKKFVMNQHSAICCSGLKLYKSFFAFLITFSAVVSQDAHFLDLPQQRSVLRWNTKVTYSTDDTHCYSHLHTEPFMCASLTVIAVVVNQNDLFDQMRRTFL